MVSPLASLAQEALRRLDSQDLPQGPPQLLVCHEGRALLRGSRGLEEVRIDALPERLDLAPLLDHTLLKAEAQAEDMDRLCDEAMEWRVASVCVNPLWVARCAARLQGSAVRTCTVAGFPLGASTAGQKVAEAGAARSEGAQEIDVVLSVGQARAGEWGAVARELERVRAATEGTTLKLILETCLLTDPEKVRACQAAVAAGVDFVKTSTGFSSGGATIADVALLRSAVGALAGVKASGGIRSYAQAMEMLRAGATRLGVSASTTILSFH